MACVHLGPSTDYVDIFEVVTRTGAKRVSVGYCADSDTQAVTWDEQQGRGGHVALPRRTVTTDVAVAVILAYRAGWAERTT